jgi:hypothetical protein
MDMETKSLPTHAADVEAELLAIAENAHAFRAIASDDMAGRYAFLFGLATMKLSQANWEIEQMRKESR